MLSCFSFLIEQNSFLSQGVLFTWLALLLHCVVLFCGYASRLTAIMTNLKYQWCLFSKWNQENNTIYPAPPCLHCFCPLPTRKAGWSTAAVCYTAEWTTVLSGRPEGELGKWAWPQEEEDSFCFVPTGTMQTQEHQGLAVGLLWVLSQSHSAAELPGGQQYADNMHFFSKTKYSLPRNIVMVLHCLFWHTHSDFSPGIKYITFVYLEPEFHRFQEDSEEAW